jgi:glycosyltransferase involved in cell wall biosynthesis
MSCPVVVTQEMGLLAVARDAQCGVVSDGSPNQLAAIVNHLHGDSSTQARMGSLGREVAASVLSWPEVGSRMVQLYRRALDASS